MYHVFLFFTVNRSNISKLTLVLSVGLASYSTVTHSSNWVLSQFVPLCLLFSHILHSPGLSIAIFLPSSRCLQTVLPFPITWLLHLPTNLLQLVSSALPGLPSPSPHHPPATFPFPLIRFSSTNNSPLPLFLCQLHCSLDFKQPFNLTRSALGPESVNQYLYLPDYQYLAVR